MTTANRIWQLDPTTPLGTDPKSQGDDYLRELARALVGDGTGSQGSFTPNFTGQYTGSASELQDAVDKFNVGYTIGELTDVDVVGRAEGYYLRFNDGNNTWEAKPFPSTGGGFSQEYSAHYSDATVVTGDRLGWPTNNFNNIPTALADVFPNTVRGLQYQVNDDHVMTMAYSLWVQVGSTADHWMIRGSIGQGTGTTFPGGADNWQASADSCTKSLAGTVLAVGLQLTVQRKVTAGQEISTYYRQVTGPTLGAFNQSQLVISARELD